MPRLGVSSRGSHREKGAAGPQARVLVGRRGSVKSPLSCRKGVAAPGGKEPPPCSRAAYSAPSPRRQELDRGHLVSSTRGWEHQRWEEVTWALGKEGSTGSCRPAPWMVLGVEWRDKAECPGCGSPRTEPA